ncbi:MAG: 4-hydroxythreonine-4-phosphate dehydrogenase 2 [Alphaproteobacteria bacterium MarineAlpha9_Bin4]|nr:4-hydroxythreonine-4-phosphate dehydrogenase PdxA [Pelagibacterales bacterium]PPR25903.1 MAG: 4-hydroxythreonine-4-phosphate dehydrogenase 2 [Alphaproteobacteria bacterium MarineAlpha9_Bin4]|tara:strand:- start:759 stop:1694 length:936 start_codon:yes stop_codon:yes gene_type:complete
MKTIGITLGDPCGIGSEISAKALDFFCRKNLPYKFIVIGNKKSFEKACSISRIKSNFNLIEEFINIEEEIKFENKPSLAGGEVAYQAICKSADLFKQKSISAIVTAPISKKSLNMAGYNFDGHTGLFAHLFNVETPYLMLANRKFSTLHVTCHMSLLNALKAINEDRVFDAIQIGYNHLVKLGKKSPKLAICGINPHAGENGILGKEEIKVLKPAISRAKAVNIDIVGPISSDIIFRNAMEKKYDLVIANYHDQGHIPVKLIYFDQSVNVTLGVPFIRTSVDHGTAFDISYKNKARARNMVAAIVYALKMV